MRHEKGFSLIELLIVVAIILIIAAIAIPSLIRGKAAAKQGSAATTVRNIATAEQVYHSSYPFYGDLTNLGVGGPPPTVCPITGPTSAVACLLDDSIACAATCTKNGYKFTVSQTGAFADDFTASASPFSINDGKADYCVSSQDLVLRSDTSGGSPVPIATATCIALAPLAQN